MSDKTYEEGLNDAWELARKITMYTNDDLFGIKYRELKDIFGEEYLSYIFKNNTPSEALAQIKAYEENEDIKVGDEVFFNCVNAIVTQIHRLEKRATIMFSDGSAGRYNLCDFEKTGRSYPQITKLLMEVRNNRRSYNEAADES